MRLAWPPPWHLIASALISLLALALANLSPESVQETSSLLALCLVILVPGYLIVLFLFPALIDIDLNKRIFLCLGFSAFLAGLVSLVLMLTPRGLQPASLATILSFLAIFLAAISYIRWSTLPRKRGFVSRSKRGLRPTKTRSSLTGTGFRGRRKALLLALAAVCVVGAIAIALSMNLVSTSQGDTLLEVSWPEEALESQSTPLETGRELVTQARIINHEKSSTNYTLKLMLNNSALYVKNLNMGRNETWQGRLGIMLVGGPGQQRLDLLLYKEGDDSKPYREEHLEINLLENIPPQRSQKDSQNESQNISQDNSGKSGNQTYAIKSTEINATVKKSPVIMEETSKVTVLSASGPSSSSSSSSAAGAQSSQSSQSSQAAGQSQSTVQSAEESSIAPASTSSTGKTETKPKGETAPAGKNAATSGIQSAVEKEIRNQGLQRNNSTNESTKSLALPAPNKEKNATPQDGSISSASAFSNATSSMKTASSPTAPVSSEKSTPPIGPSSPKTSSTTSAEATMSPQSTISLNSNLPPKLEDLKADKTDPSQGSTVQWTASASDPDGDKIYYKFLEDGNAVTDWSLSNSWIWSTSSSAPGVHKIMVLARDARHTAEDSFDDSMNTTITIMASNQPPVLKSLQPDKSGPQEKGTIILWKAEAMDSDNDKILYKFLFNGQEARKWSKSNSWSWPTENLPAGDHQITVLARDGKHAPEGSFDSSINATLTLKDRKDLNNIPVLNELKPDVISPQVQGAVITWTASTLDPDGDTIYYKFLANERDVTDWSLSNSWTWNTSAANPGDYKIRVLARDGLHAGTASFDSELERAFTLTSSKQIEPAPTNSEPSNQIPLVQELKPDIFSPQTVGAVITWAADAKDPDGDKVYYKFLVNDNMVADWSSSNYWTWNTSSAPGDYKIRVLARDGKHAPEGSFDSSRDASFVLQASNQPPILKSLKSDRSSPQVQGAAVLWKAEALDSEDDPILYKFQVNGRDMNRWSESDSWSWSSKDLAAGNYRIRVLARDGRHAPDDSFDSSLEETFALTTEIDQQIDQLMNQRGIEASGGKDYHSSDIQVAIANDTNSRAILGKSSSVKSSDDIRKDKTETPRKLG